MSPRSHHAPPGSLLSRWLSSDDEVTTTTPPPPPPPPLTTITTTTSSSRLPQPIGRTAKAVSSMFSTSPRSSAGMVSPAEYACLPTSIQRKYFSSVERLRIAQESAAQSRGETVAIKGPCLSLDPSADVLRPRTAHASFGISSFKEAVAAPRCRLDADVDEHQALRFLALPSKVKRAHFTREELILLTESSERVLGWAALHSSPHRVRQDRHGSVGSSRSFSTDSGDCFPDMEKDWLDSKTDSLKSLEHVDADETSDMHPHVGDEGASATTVNLSQSRPTLISIQRPASRRTKAKSRKRISVLAPLPLPPPRLSPAVPSFPLPPTSRPTEPSPETTYYKDTDARSKLREFLTSPAKFDEALEFGFPERGTTSPMSSVQPSLASELDELSITNTRDDDDEDEDDYLSGPRTPSVTTEGYNPGIVHHGSLDCGVISPYSFQQGKGSIRSMSPDFDASRSMTMRMSLTRSDLRRPEDRLYSMARMQASGVDISHADPLALDPLPVCDDHTGAKGAFAVTPRMTSSSGGGLKKVWKNLRKI
ncbi:uncharacterized protein RCC_02899 [Ramularia collo-cygni]|uniref:Mucin n=1 Tax=Ramularia collo-cygni TaxID=112498 RepID=A0A2D3UXN7_9PEZI|nr:uncharacterized protein RCC_02899 [Ramularia collo-cygni]CZT17067.1 uncharacterized protein RCC_02899 [Ramularia collo-cygni]